MSMTRFKSIAKDIKKNIQLARLLIRDKRTPRLAKILLVAAVGYALSPIDIIPDWIPVLGHVDDIIVVPLLIIVAYKLIPKEVIVDCKKEAFIPNEQKEA